MNTLPLTVKRCPNRLATLSILWISQQNTAQTHSDTIVLAKISPFQDGDFSEEKLKEVYNSDLANGLGNLVARVAKLAEKHNLSSHSGEVQNLLPQVKASLDES